ncbi:MAG: cell division protein FtsZ, partial [Nocardioidaceae bacterium]|nr:cell division protein FtsZ [Nocardioidaceae bacterium]
AGLGRPTAGSSAAQQREHTRPQDPTGVPGRQGSGNNGHQQPPQQPAPPRQPRQVQFDDDELDVPDFLK